MAGQLLKVRIISPEQDVFVGEAKSVSSINTVGKFDILPQHAKFVTLVEDKPLILHLSDGTKKELKFNLAIIHAHQDQVDIYTDPLAAGQKLIEVT